MWDKEFSFPMVKIVGSVPKELQIDDDFFDDAGSDDDFRIHYNPSTPAIGVSTVSHRSTSGRKKDEISAAISSMASQRQAVAASAAEMTASMQSLVKIVSTSSSHTVNGTTRASIDDFNVTEDTIDRFEAKIRQLKKKRRKASSNSKRAAVITLEIKKKRALVVKLKSAMDIFSDTLPEANVSAEASVGTAVEEFGENDAADDSSSDDDSVDGETSNSDDSE